MKKAVLFFMIFIASAIKTQAQIPNNGFEHWTVSGSCLQPEGWAGINDWLGLTENCYSMSRSEDHYPETLGNYSIKIENRIELLPDPGAAGLVWTGDSTGHGTDDPAFPITGHPTTLCGYFKFLPQNGDTMDIHFSFYKNGIQVTGGKFQESATVTGWSPFVIPVSNPVYPDADSARIMISSFNADNASFYGNSVLYIDNLSFDHLIASPVQEAPAHNSFFKLYPNPVTNKSVLNIDKTIREDLVFEIYNIAGVMVRSGILKQSCQQINTRDLTKGIYMVVVKSKNITGIQKLIILH